MISASTGSEELDHALVRHRYMAAQGIAVSFKICYGMTSHTRCGCCGGNLRRNGRKQAAVERLGQDEIATELEALTGIKRAQQVGGRFARELGYCFGGSHYHLLVDNRRAAVECGTEDVGEPEHIVYLIGICLLYPSPSPRDISGYRMPYSA